MEWLNIIVATSNFPVIYPLYVSYFNNDMLTFSSIAFVGAASFLSHLVENHKHGMKGIGFSKKTSYILNRTDVLGVFITTCRFAHLFLKKYTLVNSLLLLQSNRLFFALACILPIFNLISEHDKYNISLRNKYIFTHCLWHIGIFSVMGYALGTFIYI